MCGFMTVQTIDEGRLPVDIVAAPIFPGQVAPTYRSVIIARQDAGAGSLDDLAGARLAVNERHSWSGYHAIRTHLTDTGRRGPFFGSIQETGSHVASVEAVLSGGADTAAVDDTIWMDLAARDDRLDALAVIDRTRAWPAPPFSVSRSLDPAIREALRAALPTLHPEGLDGIRPATDADYDPIRRAAAQAGLVDLAAEVPW
jgi:ABC-type phosphate/phosphonate transport system substrate-binding protein